MMTRRLVPVAVVAIGLMLAGAFSFGWASTGAQDMASPSPVMDAAHPAHIHAGTCATLGEVVFPLEDVAHGGMNGTPTATTGSADMADMAASPGPDTSDKEVVARSESSVNATLDVILSAEHAINVHESAENIQNYIACGDITGTPTDGQLEIQLNELNDSGYTGRAMLVDNGDGTTTVTVELMSTMGMGTATPTM